MNSLFNKQILERFKAHAKDKPAKLLAKKDAGSYDLYLYDVIGADMFGGIGAKQVADELSNLQASDNLTVRINSPGGDVYEGVAIYNLLSKMPMKKTVCIDGLAASIASVIAMAGDTIQIFPEAEVMVHNAWSMSSGNAEELRSLADRLEATDKNIKSIYNRKTGISDEQLSNMMAAETWMSASKAIELKFADELVMPAKKAPNKKAELRNFSAIELMRLRSNKR